MTSDTRPFERIDSFPYRHRIADVMSRPVVTAPLAATVDEASRTMIQARVGSIIVVDEAGTATGIATERDILRTVARHGAAAASLPISEIMSHPVASVPEDALVYVAFGRMPRLGVNHLLVVDAQRRPVGVVSSSALMRLRASRALAIGDEVACADSPAALAQVWRRIPSLAVALFGEGVEALGVTAVISAILRDITSRAAELAERAMAENGWGAAPAPWCVLVLGSGGRGESAFAADQDNAIVHDGRDADDPWFAEAGRRIAESLDRAGIPLCKGGVMAQNAQWRHTLAGWQAELRHWIAKKEGESLLNVDIFFDFRPAYGDESLARALRLFAAEEARAAPLFLRLLAADIEDMHSPLGFFGWLRTEHGRFDIKRGGLFPISTAARVMALKHGVAAVSTTERLSALTAANALNVTDAAELGRAYEVLMRTLLEQQIADIAIGNAPSTRVDAARLGPFRRAEVKSALRRVDIAAQVVQST